MITDDDVAKTSVANLFLTLTLLLRSCMSCCPSGKPKHVGKVRRVMTCLGVMLADLTHRQRRTVAEPEAAYGPPGSTGEENISVVVAPIQPGFRLESLGTAEQAGRRFLETTVASINANREATLLAAESRYAGWGR